MKIKKFNESEEVLLISTDRVSEIISELSLMSTEIDGNAKSINKLVNELENYKTSSKKSNNQIDEAALNVDLVKSKLDESTKLLDTIISLLKDYNESGSKYLY